MNLWRVNETKQWTQFDVWRVGGTAILGNSHLTYGIAFENFVWNPGQLESILTINQPILNSHYARHFFGYNKCSQVHGRKERLLHCPVRCYLISLPLVLAANLITYSIIIYMLCTNMQHKSMATCNAMWPNRFWSHSHLVSTYCPFIRFMLTRVTFSSLSGVELPSLIVIPYESNQFSDQVPVVRVLAYVLHKLHVRLTANTIGQQKGAAVCVLVHCTVYTPHELMPCCIQAQYKQITLKTTWNQIQQGLQTNDR